MLSLSLPFPRFRGTSSPVSDDPLAREAARHAVVVRAVVAKTLGERRDHPDVDDAVAEVLRRTLEGRERLRHGEPLGAWMTGIARHVAIDVARARTRKKRREMTGEDGSTLLERVADASAPIDERAMSRERLERLAVALRRLPDQPREALFLFHEEGLSYAAIAARMGVPLGTVAAWILRARRAVAAALPEEDA